MVGYEIGGLLERDTSLSQVAGALGSARSRDGAVLLVSGPPGIGKSSLLTAARAMANDLGYVVLSATGGELENGFPFGVTRQLFESVRAPTDEGTGFPRQVFDAVPHFDLDASIQAVLRSLYWMVVVMAERSPLAILIDDAHWADMATLRFIDYVSRRLDDLPVVIVLAARDTELRAPDQLAALQALTPVTPLQLDLLSREATGELLSQRLDRKPDSEFVDEAWELSGGNPFLVAELAAEVMRLGMEPEAGNVRRLKELSPRSIETRLAERLRALGSSCVAMAEAFAVLGDGGPIRLGAELLGVDMDRAAEAVDKLVGAGIVGDTHGVAFRHPLLRSAVLESMARARRSALHRQAADLLQREGAEPSKVAAQLVHAVPRVDPVAARALRDGARESAARGSPESAITFLRRALEEMPGRDPERPEVLLDLGLALASLQPKAGADVLMEAAASSRDTATRARAAQAAGYALSTAGLAPTALGFVRSQLAALDYGGEREVRELARMVAELYWTVGESFDEAIVAAERYWKWAEAAGEDPALVAGERAYVECATLGDFELARTWAVASARDETLLRRLQPGDYSAMAAVVALIATDEFPLAESLCGRLREAAVRSGEHTALANCSMWSAWVATAAGDLLSAEADARTALSVARDTGQYIGVPAATLASVYMEQGETAHAAAVMDELCPDLSGPLEDRPATMTLIARAGVTLGRGRFAEALADLERIETESRATGDRNPLLGWRALRAIALYATGRAEEGVMAADQNLAVARKWGAPRSVASSLRVRSRLSTDAGERLALLAEASEVVTNSQSTLEQAKVAVAFGAELRRQGRRAEARDWLGRGYDQSLTAGAAGLAQFALAELVAAGARPRRPATTGPESLTASERRVAEMAGMGITNREIAEALYITPKTVSFHLTNCYRKLGVSNRDELSRIID